MIWVVLLLLGLAALTYHLLRLVLSDGYGRTPAPRSHLAELGTWVDRELGR